jgi:hypothetical protein
LSGDFDPRDCDSRELEDGILDREEDWLVLGRGPGSAGQRDEVMESGARESDDQCREERDREPHDRDQHGGTVDPRDVFARDLDLPRDRDRDVVHDRDREYRLNGSDVRTLSTVGAFRVVSERDLCDSREAFHARSRDLRHLEKQGLLQRVPLDGRDRAVTLTDRGHQLLERHRDRDAAGRQA